MRERDGSHRTIPAGQTCRDRSVFSCADPWIRSLLRPHGVRGRGGGGGGLCLVGTVLVDVALLGGGPLVLTGVLGHGHVTVGLDDDGLVGLAVGVGVGERVGGAVGVGHHGGVLRAVTVGVVRG